MNYYLMRHDSTLEMGTLAAIDATLLVGFTYSRADPRVGYPEPEITIEAVQVVIGDRSFDLDTYDVCQIKELCWEHIETEREKEMAPE